MTALPDRAAAAIIEYRTALKHYGVLAGVAWILFGLIAWGAGGTTILTAIVALFGIAFSWLFGWSAVALTSLTLSERSSKVFQAIIAVLVPIVMAIILATNVERFSLNEAPIISWSTLFPLAIIFAAGWGLGKSIGPIAPVRAFLGTSAALFVLTWMWQAGYSLQSDEYDPEGSSYVAFDSNDALRAQQTGNRVFQFGAYVIIVYFGLAAGMVARRRPFRSR